MRYEVYAVVIVYGVIAYIVALRQFKEDSICTPNTSIPYMTGWGLVWPLMCVMVIFLTVFGYSIYLLSDTFNQIEEKIKKFLYTKLPFHPGYLIFISIAFLPIIFEKVN